MKLFSWGKDGGPDSKVWGFWLIELKSLFSIALLRFDGPSREAYHTHAFNSISWLLKGNLSEVKINNKVTTYLPSWKPIHTPASRFHQVDSLGVSWVLTFRGPWGTEWKEYLPAEGIFQILTDHRKVVYRAEARHVPPHVRGF